MSGYSSSDDHNFVEGYITKPWSNGFPICYDQLITIHFLGYIHDIGSDVNYKFICRSTSIFQCGATIIF